MVLHLDAFGLGRINKGFLHLGVQRLQLHQSVLQNLAGSSRARALDPQMDLDLRGMGESISHKVHVLVASNDPSQGVADGMVLMADNKGDV